MAGIGGSGKGIQIVVGTDYNDRDLKRAQRDLDQLKAKAAQTASPMQKLGNTLKANVGPALAMAGAAAAAFAVTLAVDGVKAAIEDQAAAEKLTQTLKNLGLAHENSGIEDFIFKLQMSTGVVDDELRPAFERLIRSTQDVSQAESALQLALDISASKGKDLGTVANALGKAYDGNANALGRLGLGLDSAILKSGDMGAITGELSRLFAGQAAAAATTWAGRLQRLSVAFDEVKESFGTGFLQALDDTSTGVDEMSQRLQDLRPSAEQLGQSLGQVVVAITGLSKAIDYGKTAWNWMPGWMQGIVTLANNALNPFANFYDILTKVGMATSQSAEAARLHADWVKRQSDEVTNTSKAAQILTTEYENQAPAVAQVGDETASYTDALTLLREDIKNTTTRLSMLTAAFDEAEAAMARREAMQSYKDALKAFIAEPSADTRDEVVANMIAATESITDPGKAAQFTATEMAKIIDAAKAAGVNVPQWMLNIQTAATDAGDPVAKLKQDLYDIPTNIPVTIDIRVPNAGALRDNNGNGIPDAFEASGGFIDSSRYFANGGRASDTIPAWLTPGEFVIRAPMVKKWGASLFSQLNAGINPLEGMGTSSSRRPGGLTINGGVNVMSAPGEAAEQSLPRALRRIAFLAGV